MKRHGSVNRIYRLIWSTVRKVWIPVAEKTRGRGKRSAGKLIAAVLYVGAASAQAAPSGGQVIGGSGTIACTGATTTITQASANLSLNWKSFDIAPQEAVNFLQPSTSATAVNRIFDTNRTQILGHLTANGQVFLINSNGIAFGPSADVNVGALIASTLNINDTELTSRTQSFSGDGAGSAVNQDAPTDAAALTLVPGATPTISADTLKQAQNAVTAIDTELPASGAAGNPAFIDLSSAVEPTYSTDADAPDPARGAISTLLKVKRTAFDAQLAALHFVVGGVKLPDNLVNANAL